MFFLYCTLPASFVNCIMFEVYLFRIKISLPFWRRIFIDILKINPEQMDKFLELLYFFRGKVDSEFEEGIEPFRPEAKDENQSSGYIY